LPLQDKDGDRFSVEPTFRGTHWRGKDCDDSRKDFYPGRKPIDHDRAADSNCNGIYVRRFALFLTFTTLHEIFADQLGENTYKRVEILHKTLCVVE